MPYAIGSMVRARGREWLVLPESDEHLLLLRPLGGSEAEVAGILPDLEDVEGATFSLPDPAKAGDYRSARLLRNAVRLGTRSSAGPFRSFGNIAVEPRPYQLVPLLMALKLDPVRMLLADDVGIGKTIEAGLIARELIDRGEVRRLCILAPPHLAEQWRDELSEKFHLEAELVLPSTVRRLERNCRVNESIFDRYPIVVVSTDFIKANRRRDDFIRTCPELVIVDEAHLCAWDQTTSSGRHQRHTLLKGLAVDPQRHLILVTATPHSGKEEAFRSLLKLLDPSFEKLPDDLSGEANRRHREHLSNHFVQRRRGDIEAYLGSATEFPTRIAIEETYRLTDEYARLFDDVVRYARRRVSDEDQNDLQRRVRWWSALSLLRALGSSPAAAAATMRSRVPGADAETDEELDRTARPTVVDDTTEGGEVLDVVPGALVDDVKDGEENELLAFAERVEKLRGKEDAKLDALSTILQSLLKQNHNPIIFCRFIATAEYLAEELREAFGSRVEVAAVTGTLPPAERRLRVEALGNADRRILVATDCLSEGINLQERFDALIHYDLSWNPTRHEQREGRVDRFGQSVEEVRMVTLWGKDNPIDGLVLEVLLRKHEAIRSSTGISVPLPAGSSDIIETLLEGLLFRGSRKGVMENDSGGIQLELDDDWLRPRREELQAHWDEVVQESIRSRTMFAQGKIAVDEVERQFREMQEAIGDHDVVRAFIEEGIVALGGQVQEEKKGMRVLLGDIDPVLCERLGHGEGPDEFLARYELPVPDGLRYLPRTSPFVQGLASWIVDSALDEALAAVAARSGAIYSDAVDIRTTILLIRFRHLIERATSGESMRHTLAEEIRPLAFTGAPASAQWLSEKDAEELMKARPNRNIDQAAKVDFVRRVIDGYDSLRPHLEEVAHRRADELLRAHRAVRDEAKGSGGVRVRGQVPVDVVGVYVLLPSTPSVP